jgi:hypothetical protein
MGVGIAALCAYQLLLGDALCTPSAHRLCAALTFQDPVANRTRSPTALLALAYRITVHAKGLLAFLALIKSTVKT